MQTDVARGKPNRHSEETELKAALTLSLRAESINEKPFKPLIQINERVVACER